MNFPVNPTFAIRTLGCKVNQYESQAMREELLHSGFAEKTGKEKTDFFIINSCTVTAKADKDTRNLARCFHEINPAGKIVIAGCYAELAGDREALMRIPGVTHLIRNSQKGRIAEILTADNGRRTTDEKPGITDFKDRNRAFVKIQDGCDHRCSYCKVSIVRGPSRSRRAEEIAEEARALVGKGFKEIVLTGVCLGAWGDGLAGLVEKLSLLEGSFRIRLSSIEPGYVTDTLLDAVKSSSKACKHIHIPLQSGDDKVLKLMKRPYDTKAFARIVERARKYIPDAAITTDVLSGFPGEDEKRFRNTVRFIERIRPSRMHVFPYSKREGTPAAKSGELAADKKTLKERVKILLELNRKLSAEFAKGFIGKTELAVIESGRDRATGLLAGYTDRYIRVLVDGPDSLKNTLTPVKITNIYETKDPTFTQALAVLGA